MHALHMLTHTLPRCRFVSNTTFPRRAESGEKLKYEAQLPWWYDQLHDWEAAAAAGAPTTPPLQPETTFRLFTTDVSSPAFFARAAVKAAAGAMGSKQDFAERLQKLAERVGARHLLLCCCAAAAVLLLPWYCYSRCCPAHVPTCCCAAPQVLLLLLLC